MPLSRPVVALTLGDPASVGPEIVVRALSTGELHDLCIPVVVGDRRFVERALGTTGVSLDIVPIGRPGEATGRPGSAEVVDVPAYGFDGIEWGRIQAAAGRAAFESIRVAIDLAVACEVDAVATAPVNKEAFRAAGVSQIGHTEIFGERTGTADPLTLFEVKGLRIFFLTRHLPLAEAIRRITTERTLDVLRRAAAALRTLGVAAPRLAVAALNPHGGEHGLFGDEEERELVPAVAAARAGGIDALRAAPGRLGLLARGTGALRRRPLALPRPGSHRREDVRLRADGLDHLRPAVPQDLGRPRHGLRHRRDRPCERGEHGRGGAGGRALRVLR